MTKLAPDYKTIAYKARDILNCGHVSKVPDALANLHARYNDALARIATLERLTHARTDPE